MEQKTMKVFREDEIILAQGSTKQEMYKVLSGKVAVYFHYGMPEEYLVGVLSGQRCFGELSILCGKPSTYTVVALEEVLVLCITKNNFEDFIKNNTNNAIEIMKNLAKMVDTLSLNLNMLNEDLTKIVTVKNDPQKMHDITLQIQQRAALDSIQKTMFAELI